jgi:hypothetical protein
MLKHDSAMNRMKRRLHPEHRRKLFVVVSLICGLAIALVFLNVRQTIAQGPQPRGATVALGAGFTYQGQLKSSGAPVNGACDIAFRVYNAAASGTQAGSALTQTVAITDGLFTTALDFGAGVFDGNARWLDMQVRCPAGAGSFTLLTPRQALSAAPYALALPGVYQQQSPFFVGIGRTIRVTASEFFGVLAPVSSGFGGMYVQTTGTTAKPFYGYDTNGGPVAYHYLEGATGNWKLNIGNSDRLTVQPNGNVGIGTTGPLEPLTVGTTTSNAIHLGTSDPATGSWIRNDGSNTVFSTNIGSMFLGYGGNAAKVINIGNANPGVVQITGNAPGGSVFVRSDGNVGIGTTNPLFRLSVRGPDASASTEAFEVENSNGNIAFLVHDDRTVEVGGLLGFSTFHVCLQGPGNTFAACSSAAEYVPAIDDGAGFAEAGDLVSLAPSVKNPYDDEHSPFVVTKSNKPCDDNLLGFIVNPVSGADGKKLNEHYLPLAIYGYFPARVTLENGAIKRGDPLTSSSKPGYGMKATQACKIIGYALEDAVQEGTVQVFANHGENAAPEVAALRAQVQTQAEQLAAQQMQLDALNARLTALEQAVNAGNAATRTESNPPSTPWFLFGGLVVVGLVVVQHRRVRG